MCALMIKCKNLNVWEDFVFPIIHEARDMMDNANLGLDQYGELYVLVEEYFQSHKVATVIAIRRLVEAYRIEEEEM